VVASAECPQQRIGLSHRQALRHREHRAHELVQAGKGKIDFGLDPARLQDPYPFSEIDRMGQQHRLAHPWRARQHQRPAPASTRVRQEAPDHRAFVGSPIIGGQGAVPAEWAWFPIPLSIRTCALPADGHRWSS
jgi:hypothetical protein